MDAIFSAVAERAAHLPPRERARAGRVLKQHGADRVLEQPSDLELARRAPPSWVTPTSSSTLRGPIEYAHTKVANSRPCMQILFAGWQTGWLV